MTQTLVSTEDGVFDMVAGEDVTIACQMFKSNGAAFDITGVTEITGRFINADGSALSVLKSTGAIVVTSATAGQISITINDTQSALLKTSSTDKQNFEVWVDISTTRRICQFLKALKVVAKII